MFTVEGSTLSQVLCSMLSEVCDYLTSCAGQASFGIHWNLLKRTPSGTSRLSFVERLSSFQRLFSIECV